MNFKITPGWLYTGHTSGTPAPATVLEKAASLLTVKRLSCIRYLIRLEIRLELCYADLNAGAHGAGQGDASQILTL